MRFFVDTNILLYAANRDCPEHTLAARALRGWLYGATPWCLGWNVVYEFLRVSTHPRVFAHPLDAAAALRFVQAVLAADPVVVITPGERHAVVLATTVRELGRLAGNLFHDVHSAVLMREHGVTEIMTADADFTRFPFLSVTDPTRPPTHP